MTQQRLTEEYMALPLEAQRQVDDFVEFLRLKYIPLTSQQVSEEEKFPLVKGTDGKSLLRFAGVIETSELERMKEAIEEGCEKVEGDEW